jgi:1,4-alpha-glucan branching enzyme
MDCTDAENSVVSFVRRAKTTDDLVLAVYNFTPIPRHNYRVGVPREGFWEESLNSDAPLYGGSGQGNMGGTEAVPVSAHDEEQSLNLVLPPLAVLFFRNRKEREKANGTETNKRRAKKTSKGKKTE